MRNPSIVVLILAAALFGVVGCGSQQSGNPQPASGNSAAGSSKESSASAPTSTAVNNGPLASVDPCSLLPASATGQLRLSAGQPSAAKIDGSRACEYRGPGYSANVVVYDKTAYDANVHGPAKQVTINSGAHQAIQRETGIGNCAVGMAVTSSSSVDVIGLAEGETGKACQLATLIAQVVEPKLPKS